MCIEIDLFHFSSPSQSNYFIFYCRYLYHYYHRSYRPASPSFPLHSYTVLLHSTMYDRPSSNQKSARFTRTSQARLTIHRRTLLSHSQVTGHRSQIMDRSFIARHSDDGNRRRHQEREGKRKRKKSQSLSCRNVDLPVGSQCWLLIVGW